MVLLPNGTTKLDGATEEPMKVGDTAVSFTALDQSGRPVSLSEFVGRPVVLFIAGSIENPLTAEAVRRLNELAPQFRSGGAEVLVSSTSFYQTNADFASRLENPNLTLLDDEAQQLIRQTYWQRGDDGNFYDPVYVLDANHAIAQMAIGDDRLGDENVNAMLDVLSRPARVTPPPAPLTPTPPVVTAP